MLPKATIPALSLTDIVKPVLGPDQNKVDYYVASFAWPLQLSTFPQRAAYFGIAICTKGQAKLLANLETYMLVPGSLIVMEPEIIRSWSEQSNDYEEEILFFTEAFLLEHNVQFNLLNDFAFFQSNLPKVIQLDDDEQAKIYGLLQAIKRSGASNSTRKAQIVGSYINIVLNEVAELYNQHGPMQLEVHHAQTEMVNTFKQLLLKKHLELRTVNGYADLMNISSKHLSETVKANTGQTAREWIHNIVILEAKVRLKQTKLSVAAIAAALNFSDASLFGKYFRRYAGCSPATYRSRN